MNSRPRHTQHQKPGVARCWQSVLVGIQRLHRFSFVVLLGTAVVGGLVTLIVAKSTINELAHIAVQQAIPEIFRFPVSVHVLSFFIGISPATKFLAVVAVGVRLHLMWRPHMRPTFARAVDANGRVYRSGFPLDRRRNWLTAAQIVAVLLIAFSGTRALDLMWDFSGTGAPSGENYRVNIYRALTEWIVYEAILPAVALGLSAWPIRRDTASSGMPKITGETERRTDNYSTANARRGEWWAVGVGAVVIVDVLAQFVLIYALLSCVG